MVSRLVPHRAVQIRVKTPRSCLWIVPRHETKERESEGQKAADVRSPRSFETASVNSQCDESFSRGKATPKKTDDKTFRRRVEHVLWEGSPRTERRCRRTRDPTLRPSVGRHPSGRPTRKMTSKSFTARCHVAARRETKAYATVEGEVRRPRCPIRGATRPRRRVSRPAAVPGPSQQRQDSVRRARAPSFRGYVVRHSKRGVRRVNEGRPIEGSVHPFDDANSLLSPQSEDPRDRR